MVKKKVPKKIEKEAKRFIEILKKDNTPIDKVILFGSFAKGTPHKWSDIDLCVVSPKFKNPYYTNEYLWKRRPDGANTKDPWIEPVGFTKEDFKEYDWDPLIHEIKTYGIEIKV